MKGHKTQFKKVWQKLSKLSSPLWPAETPSIYFSLLFNFDCVHRRLPTCGVEMTLGFLIAETVSVVRFCTLITPP